MGLCEFWHLFFKDAKEKEVKISFSIQNKPVR